MKKIVNWTFGSVFRTFGRIIAYLIVGGLIGLIMSQNHVKISDIFSLGLKKEFISVESDIKLINSPEWSSSLPQLQQTLMFDCTGTNTCNTQIGMTQYTEALSDASERRFVLNSSDINILGNGVVVMSNSGNLKSGYIYQVNYYLCSQTSLNPSGSSFYITAIDYSNPGVKHNTYELFSSSALSGTPFTSNGQTFSACRKFESLIVPNGNYNWVGIRLKNIPNLDFLSTIALEINELGIYSDSIRTIVNEVVTANNANLATSTQLETATTQIEEAQQITTDSINNTLGNACSNLFTNNYSDLYMASYSNGNLVSNLSNAYYSYINYNSGTEVISRMNNNKGSKMYFSFSSIPSDTVLSVVVFGNNNQYKEFNSSAGASNMSFTIPNDIGTISSAQFRFNRKSTARTESGINFNHPMISLSSPNWCEYGSYTSKLDDTNNAINNVNDTLNNDDTTESTSTASNFFSNFNTNSHGLTGIITAPLNAIQSLTSKTCSPLVLPLPFMEDKNLSLPCMRPIYEEFFGGFITLYDIITLGIVSYWIMVRIFAMVKDFKNPDHDEIEVVDL